MAEEKRQPEQISPSNRSEWRAWLIQNHATANSVSLIYYKKNSDSFSMSWSDAVDEALCFGWIDSTRRTFDDERFLQLFTKRKPRGTWSKINKDKIERLIDAGLMTNAGLAVIRSAKENGSWNLLDEVEKMIVPADLDFALSINPEAKLFFEGLSRSVKKAMLQWITLAKRPETRANRITELVEKASLGLKPKQF